jgi:outer membrane protein OmpA-like peptidoglycan-associated protein
MNARNMLTAAVVVVTSLVSSLGMADVGQDTTIKRTTITTATPTPVEVDAALFPQEIIKLKDECAQMEKIGLRCQGVIPKSSLDTVHVTFSVGSALLTGDAKSFLRTVGASLKRKEGIWQSLTVEGHTDITGGIDANSRLSKARAEAVKKFLADEFGLTNINTIGRADEQLRDINNPTSAVNRRVEFIPNW